MAHKEASRNQKLAIRFLTGAWCVSCFVLVTAYSSVLISFVTSPYYKPLIESVYDIPKDPNIKITVDRGLFPDLVFKVQYHLYFKFRKHSTKNTTIYQQIFRALKVAFLSI